jgi:protein gp37
MENSKIEWTHHTFNPWVGCTKVSAGCKNCYAETMMDKRWGKVEWGVNGQRLRTSKAYWRKPLAWDKAAAAAGVRHRVFCASLADVFEDKFDQRAEMDRWRSDLMCLIQSTPNLDWLLLTKRPENVMGMFDAAWQMVGGLPVAELPTNVWIGVSVENQEQADIRIPELLQIPAAVRFLSMEPLLGHVNLTLHDLPENCPTWHDGCNCVMVDWVIVGGESGHDARPMHLRWARAIRDHCNWAKVPFFFKQWGEWVDSSQIADHGLVTENKYSLSMCTKTSADVGCMAKRSHWRIHTNGGFDYYRVGKGAAGRLLDGREWNEFPLGVI